MAIDYRERKPVSKNRPRRQPAGIFFFSIFVAVIIAYTLGLVTGWLVFRPGKENVAENPAIPAGTNVKGVEGAAVEKEKPAAENTGNIREPMLTFYDKLPKGNRELIGSGLNLPRAADQPVVKTVPPVPPQKPVTAAKEPGKGEGAEKSAEPSRVQAKPSETTKNKDASAGMATVKEEQGKGKFVVQVASYHVRKEAEELRDRLQGDGIPAYIVESNIPEKGVFYRVRVGRHLNPESAQEMAEKTGKGSIVIPE